MKILSKLLIISILLVSCNSKDKKDLVTVDISEEKTSYQNQTLKASIDRGEAIYSDFCVSCHMPNGKGVPKAFPPLANSDYLMSKRKESIKAIKYGQSGKITVNGTVYNGAMAPMGLEDKEVADVMNYITNSWGNSNDKIVTESEVSKIEP